MAELPKPSTLDSNQVLQYAFDDDTRTLRTNTSIANATIVADTFAIELDAADGDTVGISDGTNIAEVTGNKELKVKDIDVFTKLSAIDSKLSLELKVQDSQVIQKLTEIISEIASTQFSVKDIDVLNELTLINNKLSSELQVKDSEISAKLTQISQKLDSNTLKVNDSSANTLLSNLNNKLAGELTVKNTILETKLTSIDDKLTTISSNQTTLSSTPDIQNVIIASANVEKEIILPNGCKKYALKVRNYESSLKLSFSQGFSNTNYITIPRGCSYSENFLELTTTYNKLYVQSNKNNIVIECTAWH